MARTPRPGRPVRGSQTGRPIMALMDLLGRRWTLRVIWELRDGRLTFRALQEACGGLSPTVLNQRVRELRESGLLEVEEVTSEVCNVLRAVRRRSRRGPVYRSLFCGIS